MKIQSKVVVTDYEAFNDLNIERGIFEPLGCMVVGNKKYTTEADLATLVSDADYVITLYAPITEKVINSMTKCKAIVRYGIGVDNINAEAAAKRNIPVCNNPDYCIDEVADHNLAMILSLTRQIQIVSVETQKGLPPSDASTFSLRTLSNMVIGVVGFGRIGKEVARRLKPFKCTLKVFDPIIDNARIEAEGCIPASMSDILCTSDIISLQCPCNKETYHLINTQTLTEMKKGVFVINASRGGLIDLADLIKAIKSGHVGAAALDVTEPESLPLDSPLFKMNNVIITNHIAYASNKSKITLRTGATKPIVCSLKRQKICNIVNGVKV